MTLEEAKNFVSENKYPVISGTEFQSRCISGRYHSPSYLPPLARVGADAGEILTLLAVLRKIGLSLSSETVVEVILQIVGGEKKFNFHTDERNSFGLLGCSELSLVKLHYAEYGLTADDIQFVLETLEKLKRKGANCVVLRGAHTESAVFELSSQKFSLKNILIANQEIVQVYLYHATFDKLRREKIAEKMLVYLHERTTPENFKLAYDEVSSDHFLKTISYIASGLPFFEVKIDDNGEVTIEEKVQNRVLEDLI